MSTKTSTPPKVSICLPNLNTRPFLPARMESILAQTWTDWELIVCDNYSQDGAWEYFQDFKSDPRVQLYQLPREGMYANWNECLKRARGQYVYIATSDDTMLPTCLEKMVAELEAHPECGLCHCNLLVIDEAGNPATTAKAWREYDTVAYFGDLVDRNHIRRAPHDGLLAIMLETVYLSITQLLIRRSLFETTGLFPRDWGSFGDYAWQIRAGMMTNTVHVPEALATWRIHAAQASQYDRHLAAHASGAILRMVRQAVAEMLGRRPEWRRSLEDPQLTLPLRVSAIDARLQSAHGGRQTLSAWATSLTRDPLATVRRLAGPFTRADRIGHARRQLQRWGVASPVVLTNETP